MTDIVIFSFGFIATGMCAAAIGLLVWAAREELGADQTEPVRLPTSDVDDRARVAREPGVRRAAAGHVR